MIDDINEIFGFKFTEEKIELDEGWVQSKASLFGEINTELDVFREVFYYGNEKDFFKLLTHISRSDNNVKERWCLWVFTAHNTSSRSKMILESCFEKEMMESLLVETFKTLNHRALSKRIDQIIERKKASEQYTPEFVEVGSAEDEEMTKQTSRDEIVMEQLLLKEYTHTTFNNLMEYDISCLSKEVMKCSKYVTVSAAELTILPLVKAAKEKSFSESRRMVRRSQDSRNNPKRKNRRQKQRKGRK